MLPESPISAHFPVKKRQSLTVARLHSVFEAKESLTEARDSRSDFTTGDLPMRGMRLLVHSPPKPPPNPE
jgi:hypothetical protein